VSIRSGILYQISQLFSQADENQDGRMDLEEFINLITSNMGPPKNVELHDAFDIFDKDQDGVISKEDLHAAFVSVGDEYITLNLCEEIICRVDKNADGVLKFKEFKQMWKEYLQNSGGEIPFLLVDENPRRYSKLDLLQRKALAAHPETTKKQLEDLKNSEVDAYEESEYQKHTPDNTDGLKESKRGPNLYPESTNDLINEYQQYETAQISDDEYDVEETQDEFLYDDDEPGHHDVDNLEDGDFDDF